MPLNTLSPIDPNTPSPAALRLAIGSDPDTSIDSDPSLARAEAAAFLGISVAFLKKLDLAGRGPVAVRIGRRWTYLRSDLLAFRQSLRRAPEAAIDSATNDALPELEAAA